MTFPSLIRPALILLCLATLAAAARADEQGPALVPDDATLEAAGARIGTIRIEAQEIFDLRDPRENNALFRLANRLHIRTREQPIRAQLLFAPGDRYSGRLIAETERNLRNLRFLRDPAIIPVAWHDGVVDLVVRTRDVWTLQPGISWGRSGGTTSSGFEISDSNLLGSGKALDFGHSSTVDRRSNYLHWQDPNIAGGRWEDQLSYASNSDGKSWLLQLDRPFYALDTRWSGGVLAAANAGDVARYRLGLPLDSYHRDQRTRDLWLGRRLAVRGPWTERVAIGWHEDRAAFLAGAGTVLALPAGRDLRYPYVRFDLIEDHFDTTVNLNQIQRTEDLHLGWSATTIAGVATRSAGADRDAQLTSAQLSYGWQPSLHQFWQFGAGGNARFEHGYAYDALVQGDVRFYLDTWLETKLFGHLQLERGHRLDADHYLELGGDSGLRGYPLRYQQGSTLALMRIEERLYTPWYLLRLLHVGAAVFFDAGRVTGTAPTQTPSLGTLRDFGFGLRLGNARTALGDVIHVDLAVPMNRTASISRVQLLVGAQASY